MKFYCENFACLNRTDEYALVQRKFYDKGFTKTDKEEDADIILIYTCGSTEAFIKRSIGRLNKIKEKYHYKKIVVCGCASVTANDLLDCGFTVCTPTDFSELERFLDSTISKEELRKAEIIDDVKMLGRKAIVIKKGCVRKCAYCGIWRAVGSLFSKDEVSILEEVQKCAENGWYDISLTGDCIGDYGIEKGTNIIELIEKIYSISPEFKINIYDLHPSSVIKYADRIINIAGKGIFNYIQIPVQSGSRRILKIMKRDFDYEILVNVIQMLKQNNVKIGTDIIIGFPGENEDDFQQTINMLKNMDLDDVSVNVYTDLNGSESSYMKNKVRKIDILKRYNQLLQCKIRGIEEEYFEYQLSKVIKD